MSTEQAIAAQCKVGHSLVSGPHLVYQVASYTEALLVIGRLQSVTTEHQPALNSACFHGSTILEIQVSGFS